MTDLYAEAPTPSIDLRERLDHALTTIGDAELATVIATAGLAAVHDEWQRCRVDLTVQEDVARAMALRIAHLTDEARRWKRRWAGTRVQAQREHQRAEAAVALLRVGHQQPADQAQAEPCWCGHDADAHVTDDGDNAVCRACWGTPNFHQAHHVHTPEQP